MKRFGARSLLPSLLFTVDFLSCQAYLDHFSRALHYEFGHRGIFVQSLVPCSVALKAPEKGWRAVTSSWLVPPAQVYARHAVSTLGISHRTTGYWPHSLQVQCIEQYSICLFTTFV